jgi:hypothetical protein
MQHGIYSLRCSGTRAHRQFHEFEANNLYCRIRIRVAHGKLPIHLAYVFLAGSKGSPFPAFARLPTLSVVRDHCSAVRCSMYWLQCSTTVVLLLAQSPTEQAQRYVEHRVLGCQLAQDSLSWDGLAFKEPRSSCSSLGRCQVASLALNGVPSSGCQDCVRSRLHLDVVLAAVDLCSKQNKAKQSKHDINVFASKKLKTQLLWPGLRQKSVAALLSTPPGRGRD